ncbi:hypothetical protein [Brachybacterium alimentarium]|uniref:hypothetical protein n=1 Tax=Brachybacterium alimentarium TaxID=47845 RepID=UPI003FB8C3A1
MLQDDHLLEGTIGDNIRLGRATASPQEVAAAVTEVGLDAFLAGLPAGLDTPSAPAAADCPAGNGNACACPARC